MLGIRTANPAPPKQVGLVRASVHAAGVVERLADLDAATEQLLAGGRDVGDDQVQALGGAGCCRGDVLAEDDRAPGARRRELDHAEVVTVVVVGVEPAPEPPVELLRAVDIRDGDDDDLELRVDSRDAARVVTTDFVRAHGCPPKLCRARLYHHIYWLIKRACTSECVRSCAVWPNDPRQYLSGVSRRSLVFRAKAPRPIRHAPVLRLPQAR